MFMGLIWTWGSPWGCLSRWMVSVGRRWKEGTWRSVKMNCFVLWKRGGGGGGGGERIDSSRNDLRATVQNSEWEPQVIRWLSLAGSGQLWPCSVHLHSASFLKVAPFSPALLLHSHSVRHYCCPRLVWHFHTGVPVLASCLGPPCTPPLASLF